MEAIELGEFIEEVRNDRRRLRSFMAFYINLIAKSDFDLIHNYKDRVGDLFLEHEQTDESEGCRQICLGVSSYYLTDYSAAQEHLQAGIYLLGSSEASGVGHMMLGATYRSLGKIDQSVEELQQALVKLKPDGDFPIYYGYALYQMGEIHLTIKEFEVAKSYYQKGLELVNNFDDVTALFRFTNGLANAFLELEEWIESQRYFEKSLEIEGISPAEEARSLCDLGRLYLKQGEPEKSKNCLEESLAIRREAQLEDASATSMIHLAAAHVELGDANKALDVLKEAQVIIEKFQSSGKQLQMQALLWKVYKALGDFEQSANEFEKYNLLNESFKSDRERRIFQLKNKQIEEQKRLVEKKNDALNEALDELAKVKQNRKSMVFSFVTVVLLVILSEQFLEPLIDEYAYNQYISLSVKVGIALLLRPIESIYEKVLFKRALSLKYKES